MISSPDHSYRNWAWVWSRAYLANRNKHIYLILVLKCWSLTFSQKCLRHSKSVYNLCLNSMDFCTNLYFSFNKVEALLSSLLMALMVWSLNILKNPIYPNSYWSISNKPIMAFVWRCKHFLYFIISIIIAFLLVIV